MKQLKLCCPFGGKIYPIILTVALILLTAAASLHRGFTPRAAYAAMLFAAAASLLVCWLIENLPNDEERALIADAEPPAWDFAPPLLREAVSRRAKLPTMSAVIRAIVLGVAAAFLLAVLLDQANALFFFLTAGLCMLGDLLYRMLFRARLDDSARCAVIPIDRTYDITLIGHRGRFFNYENYDMPFSYMVFYTSESRFILPIPDTEASFNAVAVVKCHGMLRWTPVHTENNEVTPV